MGKGGPRASLAKKRTAGHSTPLASSGFLNLLEQPLGLMANDAGVSNGALAWRRWL